MSLKTYSSISEHPVCLRRATFESISRYDLRYHVPRTRASAVLPLAPHATQLSLRPCSHSNEKRTIVRSTRCPLHCMRISRSYDTSMILHFYELRAFIAEPCCICSALPVGWLDCRIFKEIHSLILYFNGKNYIPVGEIVIKGKKYFKLGQMTWW